jgi:DNA-binding NtrC family response regulator
LTDLEHLAAPLQRRLARRLDDGDTRVAATSRLSLSALMASGAMDAGLLHRLSVATVTMPPLRTRAGDIRPLADLLLARAARRHGVKEPTLSKEASEALSGLELHGNITELNALLTAALIANEGKPTLGAERLRDSALAARSELSPDAEGATQLAQFSTGALTLEGFNNKLLSEALRQCHGNMSAAARLLGLSRAQLAYRLRKAGGEPAA